MNEFPNQSTSRWIEIIAQHRKTYQLGPWGIIPREHFGLIAQQCGEPELAEIRLRLSELAVQSREVPEWDEEAQDEIWLAQEMFVMVLKFHGRDEVTSD